MAHLLRMALEDDNVEQTVDDEHAAEFVRLDAAVVATEAMFDRVPTEVTNQLSTESFRSGWNEGTEGIVVSFKHTVTFFSEAFKGIEDLHEKYDNKLRDTEKEYNQKSGKLNKAGVVTVGELWYFFSTGEKSDDIFDTLKKDTKFSEYVLHEYSNKILGNLKAIAKAVSGNSLGYTAIAALKTPRELFNEAYVGGYPFFHATGVSYKRVGNSSVPVESVKGSHTANKIGSNTIPYWKIIHSITALDDQHFQEKDIHEVIQGGQKYLDNVSKYLGHVKEAKALGEKIVSGMLHGVSSDVQEKVLTDTKHNAMDAIKANMQAMQVFITSEANRSVKGAKYCDLLAKRMIYNTGPAM